MFEGISRFLTGDDVFISYARADGSSYATAVARKLSDKGLACRFDQWGTVPKSILVALRRSGILVLVATEKACESSAIKEEISEFLKTGRPIIPIDLCGRIFTAKWWPLLAGLPVSTDVSPCPSARVTILPGQGKEQITVEPSPQIISRIDNSISFLKKATRLRRAANGALAIFVVLSGAAAVAAFVALQKVDEVAHKTEDLSHAYQLESAATNRASKATSRASRAEQTVSNLTVERDKIDAELATKRGELATATDALLRQKQLTEQAAQSAKDANNARMRAVHDALQVSASRITNSLLDLKLLRRAVRDALEDYLKWQPDAAFVPDSLHAALVDADKSAKQLGPASRVGGYPHVEEFDISPRGHLLLTVGEPHRPRSQSSATYSAELWDIRTRQKLEELVSGTSRLTACAISPDSQTVAIADESGELRTFAIEAERSRELPAIRLPPSVEWIRFSADGKYLLLWANGLDWTGENLFSVDPQAGTQRSLPLPKTAVALHFGDGRHSISSMQPAPSCVGAMEQGSHLTVVRTETGATARYDLSQKRIRDQTGSLAIVRASALAPNGRWFAVLPSGTAKGKDNLFLVDLQCLAGPEARCSVVHSWYIPEIFQSKPQIAFSPDGHYLLVGQTEHSLSIYALKDLETHQESPPATIDTDGKVTIDGFIAEGSQVLLTAMNHDGYTPRESQIYSLASHRIEARYPFDQTEFSWDQWRPKQADGGAFLVGLASETIHIWDHNPSPGLAFKSGRSSISDDLGEATDATISPDGSFVATAHPSGYVALWGTSDRTLLGIVSGLMGGKVVTEWAGTPTNYALYASSGAGQLFKWTTNGTLVDIIVPQRIGSLNAIHTSKNCRVVAVHGESGPVGIWTGEKWLEKDAGLKPVFALSKDATRYAVARADGGIDIFDLLGTNSRRFLPSSFPVPAENIYFAMSDERVVANSKLIHTVWDVGSDLPLTNSIRQASLPVDVKFEPNGELWAEHRDGNAYIVDLRNGLTIAERPGRNPFSLSSGVLGPTVFDFARKADLAAVGYVSGEESSEIQVWHLTTGQPVGYVPISGHARRVEFLPNKDGVLVVTPGGFPVVAPLDIDRQFQALCPLLLGYVEYSDEDQGSPLAFNFCYTNYLHASSEKSPNRLNVWHLKAAPR